MKKIRFTKMAGAGNGFVVVENSGVNLKKLVINICSPKTGLGTDGLLVLDKSRKADYKMRIINADGSEAEMCGNGARCLAAYIAANKHPKKKRFAIETLAGIVMAEANGEVANIRLSDPVNYVPEFTINVNGRKLKTAYIDTGVPHAIVYVDQIDKIDVDKIGRAIRYNKRFYPRGTNADFVEQISGNFIKVRTYERGVEGETLACGTGSTAAAIVTYLKSNPGVRNKARVVMKVHTLSTEVLSVSFKISEGAVSDVWLKGSAKFIAEGDYFL